MGLARATGWPECELLGMPLARALVYLHAYNVGEGARTKWVFADEAGARETERLLQGFLSDGGESD